MKKAISIALSLCIILASITGTLLGTAVANNATSVDLTDAANWGVYAKGTAVDGSQKGQLYGGWQGATTVNSFEGKEVATKVQARDTVIGLGIPVEVNAHYTLTLNYFVPTSAVYHSYFGDSYMGSIGIYAPNAVFSGDPAKYVSGGAVLATPADKQGVTGAWTKIELEFDSGNNTEVFFAGYFIRNDDGTDANSFYFADAMLTKTEVNEYEDAANWEIYAANGTLGGQLATNTDNWEKITNAYNFQGKDVVVKAVVRDQVSALPFAVEANKHYSLTFKYFVDSAATMTALKGVGVYTAGATFNGSGEYASGGAVLGTAAPEVVSGQWKEVTVEFDSANNTTVYLAAYWLITDQTISFADFELTKTEVNYYEDAANWKIYSGYGALGGAEDSAVVGTWEKVTTAYGVEGKDVVVNSNLRDQVVALPISVTENKYYTLTLKYFMPANSELPADRDWLVNSVGIYTSGAAFDAGAYKSGGKVLATTATGKESTIGEWKEIKIDFSSENNSTVYFAYYQLVNGSNIVYLADFDLTERVLPELNAYNNASNWIIYNNNGTLGGAKGDNGGWMTITNEYYFQGKDVAVKGYVRDKVSALPITVEANKHYSLTFKYFVNSTATMTALKGVGVYTAGATFNGSGEYASGGAVLGTAAPEVVSGQWKEVTVEFDSANNTTVYLAAYWLINDQTIYFADFALNKYAAANYYQDGSNWEVYGNSGTLDGSQKGKVYNSWMKGSTVYNFEGKDVAVLASVRDAMATLPITVEANKYYTLTFKYFVADDAAYNDSMIDAETGDKYFMKSLGVYAPNSTFSGGGYSWNVGPALGTASNEGAQGEWKEVKINFGSKENTTVYFAAYCLINTTNAVYFADMALTELPDWALYEGYNNNPKPIGTVAAPYGSWQSITESDIVAEGAKDDTSIKITANDDVVAHKLDTVKANSRYTLTFKYYVAESANEADFLTNAGVYAEGATFGAANALNTTAVSTKGAWTEATVTFDTKANTSVYFAAHITTGASDYTIYVDDLTLTEVAGLQTSYNSKAAIRVASDAEGFVKKNGLRTYNQILIDYIEGKEIVEYGSIVVRQGYLEDKFNATTDFTFDDTRKDDAGKTLIDYVGKGVGLGVAYRAENAVTPTSALAGHEGAFDKLWESTSSEKVFTSYITGIAADNYDEEYLVRVYAIDKAGNVYYGNTSSISIFKVANAIDNATGELNQNDVNAFNAFVGATEATKQEYIDWCTNNNTTTGNLFTALNAAQ